MNREYSMHICTKDRINQCNGNFDIMISITNGEQINTEKIYYDYLGKRNHVELKGNRNVGKIEVKIINKSFKNMNGIEISSVILPNKLILERSNDNVLSVYQNSLNVYDNNRYIIVKVVGIHPDNRYTTNQLINDPYILMNYDRDLGGSSASVWMGVTGYNIFNYDENTPHNLQRFEIKLCDCNGDILKIQIYNSMTDEFEEFQGFDYERIVKVNEIKGLIDANAPSEQILEKISDLQNIDYIEKIMSIDIAIKVKCLN